MEMSGLDEARESWRDELPQYLLVFEEGEMEQILALIARFQLTKEQIIYVKDHITCRMMGRDRVSQILPDLETILTLELKGGAGI